MRHKRREIALVLINILLFPLIVFAQFIIRNSSGESIMTVDQQGQVAIGVTEATALLDMQGTLRIRTSPIAGGVLAGNSQGLGVWTRLSGDVEGELSNLSVIRLMGRPISASAPQDGYVLKWNSASGEWTMAEDASAAGASGDITSVIAGVGISGGGTSGEVTVAARINEPLWNVDRLNGYAISGTAPADSQLLYYSTEWHQWRPGPKPGADLWNANRLQGISLQFPESPADEITLMYDETSHAWQPGPRPVDVVWNARKLAGYPIAALTPQTFGQVLSWLPSGQWGVSEGANAPVWNLKKLVNRTLSSSGAADSAFFMYSTYWSHWSPGSKPGTQAWNVSHLQSVPVSALNITDQRLLYYDGADGVWKFGPTAEDPMWNLNRLYGRNAATMLPSAIGQMLRWDAAESQWEPAPGTEEPIWNANQLQSKAIASVTLADGRLLRFSSAYNQWRLDYSSSSRVWNLRKLQGRPIANTVPVAGQLLQFNGASVQWEPGVTIHQTIYNANKLYSRLVATTAPAVGQVLRWNGSEWTPSDDLLGGTQTLAELDEMVREQTEKLTALRAVLASQEENIIMLNRLAKERLPDLQSKIKYDQ